MPIGSEQETSWKAIGLRVIEGTGEDVVHSNLGFDAQFKGYVRGPVCHEDVVAVNHDAGPFETPFLFGELALDLEPMQVVTKAI